MSKGPTRREAMAGAAAVTGAAALGSCAPDAMEATPAFTDGDEHPHLLSPSPTGTADTGTADSGTADSGTADSGTADSGTADTGWSDTAVETPECAETPPAGEGPYYIDGAPNRVDLRTAGESGTTLVLTGTVRSAADCRLLSDAVVEIWHVQQSGEYDMDSPDMHYRTTLQTGFDGSFEVTTLQPVSYLTDPVTTIARHIHVRINASGHDELITQLRFVDDPYADDTIDPALLMEPDVAADGSLACHFDFAVTPSR